MTKVKFPEAENRMFHRVFICMNCGAKIKADLTKVKTGRVKCRKCRRKSLRPINRRK